MQSKNPAIYYDCFSGISGDMNLAAMLDLGVPEDHLLAELKKLPLKDFDIKITRDSRNGIFGYRVDVTYNEDQHHHRDLKAILKMIASSSLPEPTKSLSKEIFMNLGKAESKIHEVPLEEVHFHEVGAVDSIIDIVGAAICYIYLNPSAVYAGTIELGGGKVNSSHGVLPVPAPATAELLKNIPTHFGGADFETTTPTGAAILATLVDTFADTVSMNIHGVGYGIGHKISANPNVLRVYTCEILKPSLSDMEDDAWVMECNIDDMNPEWYELTMEKLFKNGAQDVFLTNILMKKSRPGVKISVLCKQEHLADLKKTLLTDTTSLGLRIFAVKKTFLDRTHDILLTKFGEVRIKSSYYQGKLIRQKPEYEDCKRIALETSLPIEHILKDIEHELKHKMEK